MNIFKIGQQKPVFEGEGAGGGAGGAPAGGDANGQGEAAHPVAPWASSDGVWTVGEGEGAKPWHAVIPEEGARQHVEAKGYKNPAELALANYNLTKLQRGDPSVIGVPGENATPEEMNEFYGKLGRPETPDGYEFKFGEGVKADEGMLKFARDAFHKAGLTPSQAQTVADQWNAFAAEQNTAMQTQLGEQNDQELNALKSRWGADLDKNLAAGQRTMQALGLDAELVTRVENQIGSAAVVELLASIGRKSDEGGFTAGGGQGDPNNPDAMTPTQAQARIQTLQSDTEFMKRYGDKAHPSHKDAVSEMERLFKRI